MIGQERIEAAQGQHLAVLARDWRRKWRKWRRACAGRHEPCQREPYRRGPARGRSLADRATGRVPDGRPLAELTHLAGPVPPSQPGASLRNIALAAGALLLCGCVSQGPPGGVVVEATAALYGSCGVSTTVDPITDEVAEHILLCGDGNDFDPARVGVLALCWGAQGNQMAAILRPASVVKLPDGYGPILRYRADKGEPHDDTGSWRMSGGSVVTFESDAVERLLVSLADATDEFTFQIAGVWPREGVRYSHTVELTAAARAVEDLRRRCDPYRQ